MTDNRTTELLPCPFCGGESELKEYKPNVSGVAICKECGARSPICKNDHTGGWRPKAVAAWNTRAERTCKREKHGRKMDGSWRMRCSECGYGIGDKRLAYCPKCGAKVIQGVDNAD